MPALILEKDHSTRYHTGIPIPEVPPLENGDYLTCEEFERRYEAMPPGLLHIIKKRYFLLAFLRSV